MDPRCLKDPDSLSLIHLGQEKLLLSFLLDLRMRVREFVLK